MKTFDVIDSLIGFRWRYSGAREHIYAAVEKFERRVKGTRGVDEKRRRFAEAVARATSWRRPEVPQLLSDEARRLHWNGVMARRLAVLAGQFFDEHGGHGVRGDFLRTSCLDYVSPWDGSREAPYCDMGGEGLGLIVVARTRYYPLKSGWRPSKNETTYLVGRNEAGTYFAHPVPKHVGTVLEAVRWIWSGMADRIIRRQGDIALVWGDGPKMPSSLPRGHEVCGGWIFHDSHPPLPLPEKGQRIIVGRRAVAQVSEATRD